ncbi:hypothetical protein HJA76_22230 [Rhizobium bangladeshense]|uniref:hypothetical protein n=1 Tax=Rhizobium TaxID=379 RepID=UPI001C837B2D|nr:MULTISPECIES: hypothetical protein [Rhizobium]MBX4922356.1 hypothetical protein [Rhizobium bangladeshense]
MNNFKASESLPEPAEMVASEMARQEVKVHDDPIRPFKFIKRLIARTIGAPPANWLEIVERLRPLIRFRRTSEIIQAEELKPCGDARNRGLGCQAADEGAFNGG